MVKHERRESFDFVRKVTVMSINVILPKTGMGIEEATITKWLKTVGDTVVKGEALAEIETAKATQEVEAPMSGILTKILLAEGETGAVNTPIAIIDDRKR